MDVGWTRKRNVTVRNSSRETGGGLIHGPYFRGPGIRIEKSAVRGLVL
jgi:hypothetical protein